VRGRYSFESGEEVRASDPNWRTGVLEAGLCTRFQEDDEDSLATRPQRRLRPEVIVIRRETKVRHVQDRKSAGALVDAAMPSRRDSDTHAVSGDTYRATAGLSSGRSYQQEHRHAEKPLHNVNTVNTRKESCLVLTQRADSRAGWRSCRVGLRRRTGFWNRSARTCRRPFGSSTEENL